MELVSTRGGDSWSSQAHHTPTVISWLLGHSRTTNPSAGDEFVKPTPEINKGSMLAHCETLSVDCTVQIDDNEDKILGTVQNVCKEMKLPPHL